MHPPDLEVFEERVRRPAPRQTGRTGIDRAGEGLPITEQNPEMSPYKARGMAPDLGIYHKMITSDGTIAGSLALITRAISSSRWRVKRYKNPTKLEEEVARFVERFFGLDGSLPWMRGGLPRHLRHACQSLAYGFSPFEVTWS